MTKQLVKKIIARLIDNENNCIIYRPLWVEITFATHSKKFIPKTHADKVFNYPTEVNQCITTNLNNT